MIDKPSYKWDMDARTAICSQCGAEKSLNKFGWVQGYYTKKSGVKKLYRHRRKRCNTCFQNGKKLSTTECG